MANKILSEQDLQWIERYANQYGEEFKEYAGYLERLINTFNDKAIVQTFYASGNFGTAQKEKLTKILNAINKYLDVVTIGEDSLVSQTQKYIVRQRELNAYGNTSSSAKSRNNILTQGSTLKNQQSFSYISPNRNTTILK